MSRTQAPKQTHRRREPNDMARPGSRRESSRGHPLSSRFVETSITQPLTRHVITTNAPTPHARAGTTRHDATLSFSWSSRRRFVSRNRINHRGHPPPSLGDARRTRRRVTPRASTAQHRDAMRLNETHPLMRCVSRVEVEPQEACLSNLLRTSFAVRARMISRAVGSGKRRETRERNE